MENLIEEIKKFNEERDWDQFHSPENLAKFNGVHFSRKCPYSSITLLHVVLISLSNSGVHVLLLIYIATKASSNPVILLTVIFILYFSPLCLKLFASLLNIK